MLFTSACSPETLTHPLLPPRDITNKSQGHIQLLVCDGSRNLELLQRYTGLTGHRILLVPCTPGFTQVKPVEIKLSPSPHPLPNRPDLGNLLLMSTWSSHEILGTLQSSCISWSRYNTACVIFIINESINILKSIINFKATNNHQLSLTSPCKPESNNERANSSSKHL